MTLQNQDVTVWSGDSKTFTISITDASGGVVSLAGALIRYAISLSRGADVTQVFKDSNGADVVITNAAGGIFQVTLNPDDTKGLAPGTYFHEASSVDGGGNVSTLLIGKVTLKGSIVKES